MSTQAESYTHLHLRQHWPARLLFGLICVLSAISLVFLALSWSTPVPDTYGFRGAAVILALTFGSIGLLLALRHPQNPIGWLLLAAGLVSAVVELCIEYATYALLTKPGELPYGTLAAWIASWIWLAAIGMLIYSFLLFPTGHLPSARWRPVAWFFVGAFGLMTFVFMIRPGPLYFAPYLDNPFAVQVAYRVLSPIPVATAAALLLVGISVILRLRRAEGVERQQLKWFAYAVTLRAIIGISESLAGAVGLKGTGPKFYQYLSVAIWIAIAVAIAFAIMRYRLWDIDILINRTFVYGALTASIVGVYVLIVGGTGLLFRTQSNLLGIIMTLLLIVVVFHPLRRRLQNAADRFVPVPQTVIAESVTSPWSPVQLEQNIAVAERAPYTTLHGSKLIILRMIWVIIAMLALSFTVVSVPNRYSQLTSISPDANTLVGQLRPDEALAFEQAGLRVPLFAAYVTTLDTLISLAFVLVGLAVAWFRPQDRAALLISMVSISAAMVIAATGMFQPQWRLVILAVHAVFGASVLPTLYLFPDGRFVPSWTRWLTAIWLIYTFTWLIFPSLRPPFAFGQGLTGSDLPRILWFLLFGCSGVAAQIYRYVKVSNAIQRQQIKWVVFGYGIGFIGLTTAVGIFTLYRLAPLSSLAVVERMVGITILLLSILLVPLSFGLSILRYHLFDIDIIINRTLVYGTLTGIVVGAFVLLVGFLSAFFQSSGNSIIAIVATGLVALFFNPLRQRLQLGVNRLMYGERDDPYAVLSRLGQRLEAAYAPESVLPAIVETVAQTLKLPYVGIALNQQGDFKIAAEFGHSNLEPIDLPLIYQGEPVGELILAPRAPGEHFTAVERQLLDDLARQAGIAAHAVRLTADLQSSRERLVAAREEERRRLRRDLHDGLGPQLASLALKLEAARNRMADDPQAAALLTDLSARTQEAVADIRRLVYALRPPALDEFGLVMALREGATQYNQQGVNGLNITFDAPENLPALPAAVEVAVYRIAQEALTNVVRHAEARTCLVRLRLDEIAGFLCLDVQDDGKGLTMKRRAGVGLNSMRERAEELGGTLTVTSNSTGGTCLTARLPFRVTEPSPRVDQNTSSVSPEEV